MRDLPRLLAAAALACGALLGCEYRPGSFRYGGDQLPFPGPRHTIGCLDVSVERRDDFDVHAVLGYHFGNRCNRPIDLDLQHAKVVGRLPDGRELALTPWDPRLELSPLQLPARRSGREAIAYQVPGGAVAQICVDLASLIHRQPATWQCFDSSAGAAIARAL